MSTPERPAPTPEQIAQRSAEIRATWSVGEEERRRGVRTDKHGKRPIRVPLVSTKYLQLAGPDDGDGADG